MRGFRDSCPLYTRLESSTPTLTMIIGLPAAGKTTIAHSVTDSNTVILSSDENRARFHLKNGQSVIYDATNINSRRRAEFLNSITNIKCTKIALCVMTPIEVCIEQNKTREQSVPDETIQRMYRSWNPPSYLEGYNEIRFEFPKYNIRKYNLYDLFYGVNGMVYFDQETKHHSMTLGNHCLKTFLMIKDKFPDYDNLQYAALLHDIGKTKTKTFLNADGSAKDSEAHYYYHGAVGAYESCFYLKAKSVPDSDISYIANLIYYHMRPRFEWKDKDKERRDCLIVGERAQKDVYRLHYADISSH